MNDAPRLFGILIVLAIAFWVVPHQKTLKTKIITILLLFVAFATLIKAADAIQTVTQREFILMKLEQTRQQLHEEPKIPTHVRVQEAELVLDILDEKDKNPLIFTEVTIPLKVWLAHNVRIENDFRLQGGNLVVKVGHPIFNRDGKEIGMAGIEGLIMNASISKE